MYGFRVVLAVVLELLSVLVATSDKTVRFN